MAEFFFGDRADHNGDPEPRTITSTTWKGYQLVLISVQRQLITLRCVFGGDEGSTWGRLIWFVTHFGCPTCNFLAYGDSGDIMKGDCCCRSSSSHCDSIGWLIHLNFRAFTASDGDLVAK